MNRLVQTGATRVHHSAKHTTAHQSLDRHMSTSADVHRHLSLRSFLNSTKTNWPNSDFFGQMRFWPNAGMTGTCACDPCHQRHDRHCYSDCLITTEVKRLWSISAPSNDTCTIQWSNGNLSRLLRLHRFTPKQFDGGTRNSSFSLSLSSTTAANLQHHCFRGSRDLDFLHPSSPYLNSTFTRCESPFLRRILSRP